MEEEVERNGDDGGKSERTESDGRVESGVPEKGEKPTPILK